MRCVDVKKLTSWILVLLSLSFVACAAPEKKLAKNEVKKITTIKVARTKCPSLLKETTGGTVAGITGTMFGAIGGGIGGAIYYKMMESNGKKVQSSCGLPDFSKLVMDKFVERATNELSSFPEMEINNYPVSKNTTNRSNYLLLLDVTMIKLKNGDGLITTTTAKLIDPNNNIVWQKQHEYDSKKFNRVCKLEQLEAKKGELLHKEYHFAADKAAMVFINDLKGSV